MHADRLTSTAYVLRGDWAIYLYPWHRDPWKVEPILRELQPIPREFAAECAEGWFPIDDLHETFSRYALGDLYQETTGIHGDLWAWPTPKLLRWLEAALADGEVVAYRHGPEPSPADAVPVETFSGTGASSSAAAGAPTAAMAIPTGAPTPPTPSLLASTAGDTPSQRAARRVVAEDFYRKHIPGIKPADLASHMNGIDFSQPVQVVDIPPAGSGSRGDVLYQHSFPGGGAGQYFCADPATTAEELGANSRVLVPAAGSAPPRIVPREPRTYQFKHPPPAQGLMSVSAPITDTWSHSGEPRWCKGGGVQIMVPRSMHNMARI